MIVKKKLKIDINIEYENNTNKNDLGVEELKEKIRRSWALYECRLNNDENFKIKKIIQRLWYGAILSIIIKKRLRI